MEEERRRAFYAEPSSPERQAGLRRAAEQEEKAARARRARTVPLVAPDQLLDVLGTEPFDAVVEIDAHRDLVVRAGAVVLWRERIARPEDDELRYARVLEAIVRQRYGSRLRSFDPWEVKLWWDHETGR